MKYPEYEGKWAVILGASSGFGAASSIELAKAGLNIFGVHLDRKSTMANVDKVREEIAKAGQKSEFFNINAADESKRGESLDKMKELAGAGSVKVLLHSLAFGALKPLIGEDTLSEAQMAMTINVMASSLVYWTQDTFKRDLFAEHAKVYAMTSSGSLRVWKSYGAVSAAKCALESNCRQLALELAPHKVYVNAIMAGVTDTPALRKIPGNVEMIEIASKRNPSGRLTTPEDVGQALVALSSNNCNFMTGNTIRIDGGENIAD